MSNYKPVLVLLMGLPRSGKTIEATRLSKERGWPMVNPDSIRLALHGQAFYGPAEDFIWAIAKLMVRSLFGAGHKVVILDSTNITRKRRDAWQSKEYDRALIVVEEDKEVCLERAVEELKPVIERMFESWQDEVNEERFISLPERN